MKLTIELERATDTTEETWVSHCLEIDAISQGETPRMAIEAIAEAVDMMVSDEIAALESSGQIENPGWERAFGNIADEVAARDAKSSPPPHPDADDIYALVSEFTGRLDHLGLAGQILVDRTLSNGAAKIEFKWSGKSRAWLEREQVQNAPAQSPSPEASDP